MNAILLIIASVTLVAIVTHVYLEARRQTKPKIKVYFPDGSTRTSYRANEEINVAMHLKNIGRQGFPKSAATNMSFFVYAPSSLLLKKLQCGDESDMELIKAPLSGVFGGMHYLRVEEALNLFHGEEEAITVLMQTPGETGKQAIKIAILSAQGDLGIHDLEITIT